MSIAGLAATSFFSGAIGSSVHGRLGHARQDFQQLGQDLRAGDLTQARSDFAALQKDYPGAQASGAQGSNGTATAGAATSTSGAAAFQKLAQDLQARNLTGVEGDFQTLQTDAQQAFGRHGGHHHHLGLGSGGGGADISHVFDQLGQALQAGNISAAQQSYGALRQDLQASGSGSGTGGEYWPVPGFLNIAA